MKWLLSRGAGGEEKSFVVLPPKKIYVNFCVFHLFLFFVKLLYFFRSRKNCSFFSWRTIWFAHLFGVICSISHGDNIGEMMHCVWTDASVDIYRSSTFYKAAKTNPIKFRRALSSIALSLEIYYDFVCNIKHLKMGANQKHLLCDCHHEQHEMPTE